ncbi:LOW QUALITY PROTEIN: trithorax group protein osa-like [Dendronephthya gigantea]|uniref:LOW QUALITY PROTEIN: trithorax group protein osa-like n=1 Tax=Dendronephthya gigantea TaxID=151771 RepID=UPI00106B6479|nr:LOW QUALITY PROTEIN: trithorax group protein osa-like [Dendronephthya gigantea]
MSYGEGYPYGTTNNFATTYTPAEQSQNQYNMPPYNPYMAPPQQNTASQYYPYNTAYGNSSYNTYGQQESQGGSPYPPNGPYAQQPPTTTQGGQSYHSDGLRPPLNQPYNQAPPPTFNQVSPPTFNQVPPQHNEPAPLPSYNQVPPPSNTENMLSHQVPFQQQGPTHQQGPCQSIYTEGQTNPQQGVSYPQLKPYQGQQGPSYPTQDNAQGVGQFPQTSNYQPSYSPTIGPQRPPKRPHMPQKFQTSFKQAKKSVALPPQTLTSMQPLQGGKSAVSTVHDLARQNGWTANWFEESETGPAHAKMFTMKVTMGPYEVSGSGRSKKLAKQDAAQLLVAQASGNEVADILGLPGFTAVNTSRSGNTSEDYGPQLPQNTDEKTSPVSVQSDGGDNPISLLEHVARKHKLGEPQYISVCENGPLALQRFDIKVKVNNMEASGLGRSKKVAKRNAAQAMLDQLSKIKTGIQPPKKRIMFVKASSDANNTTYES